MWVTQTYLGNVESDAQLFVYYLFEDYSSEQTRFTKQVQRKLEEVGEAFGKSVSLLMPNPRYAAQIESEVRGIQDFWWTLQGKLPGLLISTKPLTRFDPKDGDYFLIPFATRDPAGVAEAIERVRTTANNPTWQFERQAPKAREALWRRFFDALELKPGFAGVRVGSKENHYRGRQEVAKALIPAGARTQFGRSLFRKTQNLKHRGKARKQGALSVSGLMFHHRGSKGGHFQNGQTRG